MITSLPKCGEDRELVIDFWRTCTQHHPLTISGPTVERVSNNQFLEARESSSTSTSSANWGERDPWQPSCAPSAEVPLKASWHHYLVGWKLHRLKLQNPAAHIKCSRKEHWCIIAHFLDIYNSPQPEKQSELLVPTPSPHKLFSVNWLPGEGSGASVPPPSDLATASYTRLSGGWTLWPPSLHLLLIYFILYIFSIFYLWSFLFTPWV